jgi:hypothetical protein
MLTAYVLLEIDDSCIQRSKATKRVESPTYMFHFRNKTERSIIRSPMSRRRPH